MDQASVRESVKAIISKVAGYPLDEIRDDIRIRDDLLVDSLKQMEIVARIEHHFGVQMNEGELAGLETLGEFFSLVNTQVAAVT